MKQYTKKEKSNVEAIQYNKDTMGEVVMFWYRKLEEAPQFIIDAPSLTMTIKATPDRNAESWVMEYGDFVYLDNNQILIKSEKLFKSLFMEITEPVEPDNPNPGRKPVE